MEKNNNKEGRWECFYCNRYLAEIVFFNNRKEEGRIFFHIKWKFEFDRKLSQWNIIRAKNY